MLMEAAPNRIIQSAEQPDTDSQKGVHKPLIEAGHNVAPESLNPNDESPLDNIKGALGDAGYDLGTTFGATFGSEVSFDRTTGARDWLRRLRGRVLAKWKQVRNIKK